MLLKKFFSKKNFFDCYQRTFFTSSNLNQKISLTCVDKNKKPLITNEVDAFKEITSNSNIYCQMGANTPQILLKGLSKAAEQRKLKNIKIHQLLTLGTDKNWTDLHQSGVFRGVSYFTSPENRSLINKGLADYTPIFLRDISRYFTYGPIEFDAVIVQVSPADKHGFHSLGANLICVIEAILKSKKLICQVNKNISRTFGDSSIHESQIDIIVEKDADLIELITKNISEEDDKIGKLIAENLIEDGSTLQMGIGTIPDVVLKYCSNYKNLGIHSEMISDGVIDLIENGSVTNHLKPFETNKTLVTFALGSKRIYDYLNDNPNFVFRTSTIVNDEYLISQNPKMTAINSCIEIDLQGQVCSDTIGSKVYSGFGGQVDFLRGASIGKDGLGKPILAFNSLTNKGESKIVPNLKPSSGVVSTRAHVHYVVTEFGIANLFGKSIRQRAYELIQIAHPKFREQLEKSAFEKLGCMPSKN